MTCNHPIYDEGYAAYHRGIVDRPAKLSRDEGMLWLEGWSDAYTAYYDVGDGNPTLADTPTGQTLDICTYPGPHASCAAPQQGYSYSERHLSGE